MADKILSNNNDILKETKLDFAVRESTANIENNSGAEEITCGRPISTCSPCGSFGPVRCPCMLNCAPIGARCCCIEQPRCASCIPGCCMCYNSHGIPRQPVGRPRCCMKRCI